MTRHRDCILRAGRRATLLSALAASAVLLPAALGQAAQPSIFLDENPSADDADLDRAGERRPEPLRHRRRPGLRRHVEKDDVLVSNFNNDGNLQGLGTTIVDYNPTTKKTVDLRRTAAKPAGLSRRRRTDDGDDHAEVGLGDRRQRAEHRWHDRHEGRGLPDRARFQRQGRGHDRGREHQHALGQHGDDRRRVDRDAVRQQRRASTSARRRAIRAVVNEADRAAHQAVDPGRQAARRRRPDGHRQRLRRAAEQGCLPRSDRPASRSAPTARSMSRTRRQPHHRDLGCGDARPQRGRRPDRDQGRPAAKAAGDDDRAERASAGHQRSERPSGGDRPGHSATNSTRDGSTPTRRRSRRAAAICSASP